MKYTIIHVSVLLALGLSGINVQSALIFQDPFDYSAGSSLGGQGGWVNANSGDEVTVASGNLSASGLATSSGNMVTFGGAGYDPQRTFTAQNTTLYYSFILRITDLGSLNTIGGYFAGFGQNATTFGATFWAKSDGEGGFQLGINQRTTVANTVWSASSQSVDSVILIVGSYVVNSGTANDRADLWINPNASTFSGTAPAAHLSSTPGSSDLSSIDRFFIRQDSTSATPGTVFLDELRVGSSWADVTPVPEPIALALPIFGSIAVFGNLFTVLWRKRGRCEGAATSSR